MSFRSALFTAIAMAVLVSVSTPVSAAIIPLPGFGPDDGSTLFNHDDLVVSVEIFELPALVGATTFGFFFGNNPGSLTPIFDALDQPAPQAAAIDFGNGLVFDVDSPGVPTAFTGSGAIGFYLSVPGFTFYSVPSLNPGGIDPVATFPALLDPSVYEIGFENPGAPNGPPLVLELVIGIQGVPEPSTTLLLGLGAFVGMTSSWARRRRTSKRVR